MITRRASHIFTQEDVSKNEEKGTTFIFAGKLIMSQ
jgi:hypothetical protein